MSTPAKSDSAMTESERSERRDLIDVVTLGQKTFVEVGNALAQLRDKRLYRESHKTFEAFCQEMWGFTRQRAHQLIEAAGVTADLSTRVDKSTPPPATEKQARELAKAPPEKRAAAWKAATDDAKGGKVTAKAVKVAVQRVTEQPAPQPEPEAKQPDAPAVPAEPPEKPAPWAAVDAGIDEAIGHLKAAAAVMRRAFGIKGQDITEPYAKRFGFLGTVGAVNSIVRTLEAGRVVGEDDKGPITASDRQASDALRKERAA